MIQEEIDLMNALDAAADQEWSDLLAEHEQNDREEAGENEQDSRTSSL